MNDELCEYCGEFPGSIMIPNPNYLEENMWYVCPTCDKLIKQQMKLTLGQILNSKGHNGNKIIKEATDEIAKLVHESGLDITCIKINK